MKKLHNRKSHIDSVEAYSCMCLYVACSCGCTRCSCGCTEYAGASALENQNSTENGTGGLTNSARISNGSTQNMMA